MKVSRMIACVGLTAGFALAAHAADMSKPVKFKATLTAAQEVPPNSSTGKGKAEFTLDPDTKELSWKVTYEGLTGDAFVAHIHGPAEAGTNAGVEIALSAGGMKTPLEGKATLTDAQISDIESGKTYINIHTAANKSGEIRGQITK